MCGILGIAKLNKKKEYPEPSVRCLTNRGPDGIGRYSDNGVILYHARLAVIDEKESSNQPIISGDFVLVANGEVYNFEEIKKTGQYKYVSTSDCEAIIHVYKNFGVKGFSRLDGTFSFCLYDKKKKKLIIHRDNVGKKPLFFLNGKDAFIFASNLTAITDNYSGKLTINKNQIDFYLKNGFMLPKETFLREIEPLLPGEICEINLVSKKTKKGFLKKDCADYKKFDFSNYDLIQEKIEDLISQAVFKRMKNVKEPVLLFSGGIDSTVLAHFMLRANKNTKIISVKQPFVSFLYDEPYARFAAKIIKAKIIFAGIFKPLYENLDLFIGNLDQPLSLYSYYFLSALSLEAKKYGKVLFTGDGGDEAFYGYQDAAAWFAGNKAVRRPEILVGPPPKVPLSDWGLMSLYLGLLGHAFVKLDKATAENQMESRCPFLDWELMCFLRSVSEGYWEKFNSKYPLKKILKDAGFPASFINRKKIGFAYPFRYAMIFKYPYLLDYLKKKSAAAKTFLGMELKNLSYFNLFKNFNFYWKAFVLLKFLDNNNLWKTF